MPDPTLVIVWAFTWIAVAVMCLRLALVKLNKKAFSTGDYLTIGAILCAITRLSLIHVVLIWGSNNVSPQFRTAHVFTEDEIYRREIGGKLTIVNRLFYNSYLWLQKLVLLDFYRHLIYHLRWERITMISFLFIFGASYVVVQIVSFTECQPLTLYWRVIPDPGKCSQAQVQLITLGVLNIITDIMLIILPIPVLAKLRRSFWQKLQLFFLFSLGLFIVAVTLVRLPQNANHATAQVNRTTWASAELLTASFVAHAPALYTLCKPKEGSGPPHVPPTAPLKDSHHSSGQAGRGSGSHPDPYELQEGRNFAVRSHADTGSGTWYSDRESGSGIMVTSDIQTEFSPRSPRG